MSFSINFSFSLSFSLGREGSCERHLNAMDREGNSPLTSLPQHNIEPSSVIKLPVPTKTPTRPVLPRLARYVGRESASPNKSTVENKETPIPDTLESKASGRESLKILLDSSKQQVCPNIITTPSTETSDKISNSSLVQHSSSLFVTIPSEDPFVSSQSPGYEDDSGSELVSSLQRLRLGGLSSYLKEMGRRADLSSLSSTGSLVSPEQNTHATLEEADAVGTNDNDSDEWEMVASGQCWKKHKHVRE